MHYNILFEETIGAEGKHKSVIQKKQGFSEASIRSTKSAGKYE